MFEKTPDGGDRKAADVSDIHFPHAGILGTASLSSGVCFCLVEIQTYWSDNWLTCV